MCSCGEFVACIYVYVYVYTCERENYSACVYIYIHTRCLVMTVADNKC
jgi:hypothetical protein